MSIVSAAANQNATATVRAEDLTLEVRQRVAEKVGDRFSGPGSTRDTGPAPVRQERARSYVEQAKLRRMRARRAAVSLPPHNPARKYTYAEIQALGKEALAYKKLNGTYSFPVVDKEDLENGIHAIGRAPDDERLAVKRWLIIAANRVHGWGLIPEG